MNTLYRHLPLLVLATSLGLVACKAKDEPETTAPSSGAAGPDTLEDDEDPNQAAIRIGPKILELCGISADKANFEYNSAKLSASAKAILDEVATCFVSGPGVGKNMDVVGHADPRGSEDYNFALGQKRAGNVSKYFGKKGLGEDRVASSSRGEMDATGTDAAGWAADRRVDILLAE